VAADAAGQQNGRNGSVEKRSSQAKTNVAMRILPLDYRAVNGTNREDQPVARVATGSGPQNGNGLSYSNGVSVDTTTMSYVAERFEGVD
jgi:hypothetical protein